MRALAITGPVYIPFLRDPSQVSALIVDPLPDAIADTEEILSTNKRPLQPRLPKWEWPELNRDKNKQMSK